MLVPWQLQTLPLVASKWLPYHSLRMRTFIPMHCESTTVLTVKIRKENPVQQMESIMHINNNKYFAYIRCINTYCGVEDLTGGPSFRYISDFALM